MSRGYLRLRSQIIAEAKEPKKMEYEQAKQLVLDYLNTNAQQRGYRLALYEPATAFEFGWIFRFDLEAVIGPHAVTDKVDQWGAQGKSKQEIDGLLTEEEKQKLENEIGLVGNAPIFIDKQTKQIRRVRDHSEIAIEEIREERSGLVSEWGVYLVDDLAGDTKQISKIKQRLGLTAREVIQLIKQKDQPLLRGRIGDVWYLHRDLKELGIELELRKIE